MSPLLGRTDHAARTLPIATRETVRAHTRVLLRDHRRPLSWVLLWHGVAALVALVGPWVVGQIVEEVTSGGDSLSRIDVLVGVLVAAILVQTVITWLARKASFVLSERIFARLREDFITSSVRLPLSTVERAGTGDLVARTTNDVDSLAHIIRFGIPAIVVALTTVAATTVAAVLTSPLAALALLTAAIVQVPTSRWYLARAGDGYLWEHASYARLNGVAAETVEGAQTMDALGLQAARGRRFSEALAESGDAERYTLGLRLRWFPWLEIGFFLPIATSVLWGGWLVVERPHLRSAAAIAVTLYIQQLLDPLGELISWLDEIQFAATSLARDPRRLGGAARPRRHGRRPGRRGRRRRRRALRVPRGTRRAARRLAGPRPGRAARHRGSVGGRQVDARAPHGRHRRTADRPGRPAAACRSSTSTCRCCVARSPS